MILGLLSLGGIGIVVNILLRFTIFNDSEFYREEGMKLPRIRTGNKKKYERWFMDLVTAFIIYYTLYFTFIPELILVILSRPFWGIILTLALGLLPLAALGGYVYGISIGDNSDKYTNYLKHSYEKDVKLLTYECLQCFTKSTHRLEKRTIIVEKPDGKEEKILRTFGVIFEKAPTFKDGMNDNHKAYLLDKFGDTVWETEFDEQKYIPIWSREITEIKNKKIIQTFMDYGKEVFDALVSSINQIDLNERIRLVELLDQLQERIVTLESDNHILRAQKKVGILDLTSIRVGVIFALLEKCAGETVPINRNQQLQNAIDEGTNLLRKTLGEEQPRQQVEQVA